MTAREISDSENFGYKDNTIFKKIAEFEAMGYIAAGYKEGKAKTFYITEKGKGMKRDVNFLVPAKEQMTAKAAVDKPSRRDLMKKYMA